MPEFDVRVGFGHFGKRGMLGYGLNFGQVDREISLSGKQYPHGISMHPPSLGESSARYRLGRQGRTLNGWAGLNDIFQGEPAVAGPAVFKVLGDGRLLWTSKPNQNAGTAEEFNVNVQGVDVLQLQVHCSGQQTCVRAVWLEPRVTP
jgi:hypothetical protein